MTPSRADIGQECERCGSDFRVERCVVHRDEQRGRIEGYLCYDCRDETPNESLAHATEAR